MGYKFNPFVGNFDKIISGFPATGFTMTDDDGVKWRVTIGTDGNLITTLVDVSTIGKPIGLLLSLTYAN